MRVAGTAADDLRHVHGMARIRHAYTEIAPPVVPYFSTATHDDVASVLTAYGPPSSSLLETILYAFSTSLGLVGLITAMVGGVLAAVIALLLGLSGAVVLVTGAVVAVLVVVAALVVTFGSVTRNQAALDARFPAPGAAEDEAP